jgi:SAM-dependent methyltransferase
VSELPEDWAPVLNRLRAGEISPQIALAQLLMADREPNPATRLAEIAAADPEFSALAKLAADHPDRIRQLQALIASGLDPATAHDEAGRVAATAAHFDRLAVQAPEAGVAIYSLGSPELLARATDELIDVVARWAPLAGSTVLDFGCGIGRVCARLAPLADRVVGVDVSGRMIAEARLRVTAPNVRFEQSGGSDLSGFADESFDLVLAVDSFPFLVRVGEALLARTLAETARLLRVGGSLVVFNWSYRGDLAADAVDAERLGTDAGFRVLRSGERPFQIWDGVGFQLVRI